MALDKLLKVSDIAERYGITERTARQRMREMGALDVRPMVVPESAVIAWESRKRAADVDDVKEAARKKASEKFLFDLFGVKPVPPKPGQMISRVRPKRA